MNIQKAGQKFLSWVTHKTEKKESSYVTKANLLSQEIKDYISQKSSEEAKPLKRCINALFISNKSNDQLNAIENKTKTLWGFAHKKVLKEAKNTIKNAYKPFAAKVRDELKVKDTNGLHAMSRTALLAALKDGSIFDQIKGDSHEADPPEIVMDKALICRDLILEVLEEAKKSHTSSIVQEESSRLEKFDAALLEFVATQTNTKKYIDLLPTDLQLPKELLETKNLPTDEEVLAEAKKNKGTPEYFTSQKADIRRANAKAETLSDAMEKLRQFQKAMKKTKRNPQEIENLRNDVSTALKIAYQR